MARIAKTAAARTASGEELSNFEKAQVAYRGTIRTFARNSHYKLRAHGYDLEDIEQELLQVLWRCVLNYDPDKGASFNTLFQGSAKNALISLFRKYETQSRAGAAEVVHLEEEDVALAVAAVYADASAEDYALANMAVRERLVS